MGLYSAGWLPWEVPCFLGVALWLRGCFCNSNCPENEKPQFFLCKYPFLESQLDLWCSQKSCGVIRRWGTLEAHQESLKLVLQTFTGGIPRTCGPVEVSLLGAVGSCGHCWPHLLLLKALLTDMAGSSPSPSCPLSWACSGQLSHRTPLEAASVPLAGLYLSPLLPVHPSVTWNYFLNNLLVPTEVKWDLSPHKFLAS